MTPPLHDRPAGIAAPRAGAVAVSRPSEGVTVPAQLVSETKIASRPQRVDARDEAIARLAVASAARGYRIAFDLLGDAAEAEDAVQEALARACDRFDRLRDPAALEGWFLRILTNQCLRALRRRRLFRMWTELWARREEDEDALPGPDVQVAAALGSARLLRAVERLPPMQRTAVVLRYGHDLAVEEIGRLVGVSTGTVKTHLVRGLRALRAALAGGEERL
jgi:RNA polymerase sigma-70 factor (ECF subfamily)